MLVASTQNHPFQSSWPCLAFTRPGHHPAPLGVILGLGGSTALSSTCAAPVIQLETPKWSQHISQLVRQLPADAASGSGTQKCLMQASIIRHWRKVNKRLFCNLGLPLKHGLQDRWNSLPQWKVTQSPCILCKTREWNWCCEEGALSLKCTSEHSGLAWNRAASRWSLEQQRSKGRRALSEDLSYIEPEMSTDRPVTLSYRATVIQISYDQETVEWY